MRALFLKDLRLNTGPFVAFLVLLVAIPAAIFVAGVMDEGWTHETTREALGNVLTAGGFATLATSLLVFPAFGAIAFARERRDRSGDFLGSLPISRAKVIASKLLATLSLCALPWVVYIAMPVLAVQWSTNPALKWNIDFSEPMQWILVVQIMLVGCSWLFSSMMRGEVLAAALTFLLTILFLIAFITYRSHSWRYGPAADAFADAVAFHGAYSIGLAAFITGTIIAMRRISP